MNKLNYITLSIITILITSSCKKELEFDFGNQEKKLAVSAMLTTEKPLYLYISKSLVVNEATANFEFVENAEVKFYEDNLLIQNLVYDEVTRAYGNFTMQPIAGKLYKIEVIVPGFEHASIETRMPEEVLIEDITVSKRNVTTEYGTETEYKVAVSFTDIADQENYYVINAAEYKKNDADKFLYYHIVQSKEPSAYAMYWGNNRNPVSMGIAFKDSGFDGQKIVYDIFYTPSDWTDDETVQVIQLFNVSEELYKFVYSRYLSVDIKSEPYAEPVVIYSSATNALGILGAYTRSVKEF